VAWSIVLTTRDPQYGSRGACQRQSQRGL
jgi:hypothetical protein